LVRTDAFRWSLTGWSIGHAASPADKADRASAATSLYDKLENEILPCFYRDGQARNRAKWRFLQYATHDAAARAQSVFRVMQ